ncbi:MAG: PQQ-dependent sugar dehydrogenase [Chitinophagia bacterium]
MKKIIYFLFLFLFCIGIFANAQDNAGLTLPAGFKANLFAENIGGARHIAITKNGVVFAKLNRANKQGQSIVRLEDANKDGVADKITGLANYGGTGIYLNGNNLYASSNEAIFKYELNNNDEVLNPLSPVTVVSGLINRRQHESKSITFDKANHIYVNIGAYSNACQEQDRTPGSKGKMPCPILDSAGGIWKFDGNKENQTYGDGIRYATGLRNVVGLDWNTQTNKLYVSQHGRDQLNTFFPSLYTDAQNAELPAETFYEINEGDNAGWPYIYYDPSQHKKIVSPEYGGDGQKEGASNFINPAVAFPAHMAPMAVLFYTGNQFPAKYKNGAFITFHGSWNRAPLPQEGFFVAFVPFKNGKATGEWEIFANGFAGTIDGAKVTSTNKAKARPCGLAQGPDGSIYVSDDTKGAIFKISYNK